MIKLNNQINCEFYAKMSTFLHKIHTKKPVIVHINGNVDGTSRHYSVIVGIKQTADSSNLKETDFLLLDVWEGELEQLNGKGNNNGVGGNSRFMITGTATGREYGYQLYIAK